MNVSGHSDDTGRDSASRRLRLKRSVDSRQTLIVPGVANPLAALLVEQSGFEAVYLSGAAVANTDLGVPDIGLTGLERMADAAARISDVCGLPLLVDIDTGYGNAINVRHAVRTMERAGAAAVQIEDQVFPKKCGHFSGKAVIPIDEMKHKVLAAAEARHDGNLLIIARTDARATDGLAEAIDRGYAMVEAGADIMFIEAPETIEELEEVGRQDPPQLVNAVFGGRTPVLGRDEYARMGFTLVLYANALLQTMALAGQELLNHLRDTGSLAGHEHRLMTFEERQKLVRKARFDELEARYKA